MNRLEIKNLHVSVGGKEILKGVNLEVTEGQIVALMGPNGSGKSTLSFAVMGHPNYLVTKGDILLSGESILSLKPDERARKGLFLSFQYPSEIAGVTFTNFLRTVMNTQQKYAQEAKMNIENFKKLLEENARILHISTEMLLRAVNEGFSGGEKKKAEMLQLALLKPRFALLDETDSGLDIDALKVVAHGIKKLATPECGMLLITHYQRILHYVAPHIIHVLLDGKIVHSGGKELARELEEKGYDWLIKNMSEEEKH